MDFLNQLFGDINSVLWGVFVLIPLLCGTGIFYTFKLRFVQIRLFPTALRFRNAFWQAGRPDRHEFFSSLGHRGRRSSGYR